VTPVYVSPFVVLCKFGYIMIGDMTEDLKFPDKLKLTFPVWDFNRRYKMVYERAVHGKFIGNLV